MCKYRAHVRTAWTQAPVLQKALLGCSSGAATANGTKNKLVAVLRKGSQANHPQPSTSQSGDNAHQPVCLRPTQYWRGLLSVCADFEQLVGISRVYMLCLSSTEVMCSYGTFGTPLRSL